MSVRQSLLAILDQGACYGYQLRSELERRTGSNWLVNVGQIYTTLDRLERDGLVAEGDTDEHGHVYYEITEAGRAEARAWLTAPVPRAAGTRDELPLKVALAATLPGVDVSEILRAQRVASRTALADLREAVAASEPGDSAEGSDVASHLIADAQILRAEAELRWLDRVEERLARSAPARITLPLDAERPRRGRPPRGASSGAGVLAGRTRNARDPDGRIGNPA